MSIPGLPPTLPATPLRLTANRVHSVSVRLLRLIRNVDQETGLSGPRASLLSVLVFAGPLPVSRLARIEQVSVPAVTKLVDGLERGGLAARTRTAEDRRVVMVSATAAGQALLEAGRARRVEAMAGILAALDAGQLKRVDSAFRLLEKLLGRPPANGPRGGDS